jgi:hypothetical protein
MDLSRRLDALLEAAEQMNIDIRAEPMGGGGGGICRLRGRRVLFVDTSADLATRYDRTLAAMAGLEELDGLYLLPEVRQDIEHQRRTGGGRG